MGQFNLNEYITVKERKVKFYKDNPDGRIVVKNVTPEEYHMDYAMFYVEVFLNKEDQEQQLPKATGTALEIRDKDLKQGKNGMYESVNYTSWTENCEESAVGRALDNAGYSGNNKASKEEMEKIDRNKKAIDSYNPSTSKQASEKQVWKVKNDFKDKLGIDLNQDLAQKDFKRVCKFSLEDMTSKQASDLIEALQDDDRAEVIYQNMQGPLD